ncbi:MAG: polysaccharide biosynthesis/export family protein [Simkaniaceae bacterium]|nr:polysaccharide biosynthesis/export family protein [Simkaniaceae bacterium]
MKRFLLYSFLVALCAGCGNRPVSGSSVVGAHEFVMDSYKIAKGKYSILELEGQPLETLSPKLLSEYPDVIENGDVLDIAIYHPTRKDIAGEVSQIGKSMGYRVEEGKIILPDLPAIEVRGLTLSQAREAIEVAYGKHLSDMNVFISYKERLDRKVSLIGMVSAPSIPVNGKLRIFDVLAEARIPAEANLFKSYVVRKDKALPVDLYRLVHQGDMSQNIVMRGGDKVFIADPSASNIMVMGEVRHEGMFSIPSGTMPLRDALASAGGILFTGNKAYIQVIRGNILKPKVYTLSWKHIVRLPTNSLLLMPGDIVYVGATPITQWNRLITQLIPSFSVYEIFAKGVKGVIVGDMAY